jgi:23S rRNA (cytosine1962-C5)-methyltransferase
MPTITLKPGREKSLLRRHPWVFSGAIARLEGEAATGDTVLVEDAQHQPLGWGAYSPRSQIAVRMWTFDPDQAVDESLLAERLSRAAAGRDRLARRSDLNAYRLIYAESDGLPGVVVDRYGDFLVCQFLSAGAEKWKPALTGLLAGMTIGGAAPRGLYERSDVDVREKEGLPPMSGVLAGAAPPETLVIDEYGCRFQVQVAHGHKTGFYLDQRDNRLRLSELADGRDVLNAFAYTGAFGVWALRGGARHVVNLESSQPALDLGRANIALNGLDDTKVEDVAGDAFRVLRLFRDSRREFDLIVLDPPKFADSRSQLERATRGYKDINLLALKLLRPGGILMTFSCSGLVTPELFQQVVAGAALDARRDVQVIGRLSQASDHPIALNFPEGEYLKGLLCRVAQ